jgi:uncharacterized protein (TIGR03435 family)
MFVSLITGLALAQSTTKVPDTLRFEVASFKPSPAGGRGGQIRPAQGGKRYEATNCPIRLMIQVAYRLKPEQIVGGPDWINTDLYEMNGVAEKPSNPDELHTMLMNLLVDRCQLKFHHDTKDMAAYVLSAGKDGPQKMTPHDPTNTGDIWIDQNIQGAVKVTMNATYVDKNYFAFRLGQLMDRPVVDQTGIKGSFDFKLNYTRDLPPGVPEGAQINGEPIDTSGPTVFMALKQQLGLELKAQKAPVDVIVIDHMVKPSEN